MLWQTRPSMVQIMAWHLFSAKPLFEPMLAYCRLDPWQQISVKYQSKYNNFHIIKSIPENVVCKIAAIFFSVSICYRIRYVSIMSHWWDGPLLLTLLTLIPTWISNNIYHKVWGEITYPFPNFNSATIEVCELISSHILLAMWLLIHVSKRGPWHLQYIP